MFVVRPETPKVAERRDPIDYANEQKLGSEADEPAIDEYTCKAYQNRRSNYDFATGGKPNNAAK
jgi:hypothetical protein